jgi:hypothetical protein
LAALSTFGQTFDFRTDFRLSDRLSISDRLSTFGLVLSERWISESISEDQNTFDNNLSLTSIFTLMINILTLLLCIYLHVSSEYVSAWMMHLNVNYIIRFFSMLKNKLKMIYYVRIQWLIIFIITITKLIKVFNYINYSFNLCFNHSFNHMYVFYNL